MAEDRTGNERQILNSWKEISAYLERGIRTCQRWEKELQLPIYRIDASPRAKVFAYKDEIDEWLKERIKRNELGKKGFFERKGAVAGTIFSLLLVVVALVSFMIFFGKGNRTHAKYSNPSGFLVKSNVIYFINRKNEYLWDVKLETAKRKDIQYSDYFEGKRKIDFANIDTDKENEVVIFLRNYDPEKRALAVYDNNGREIWKKRFEFRKKYKDKTLIPRPFNVECLKFEDVVGDKKPEILALWRHEDRFPSALIIYSLSGDILYSYYHTGHAYEFWVEESPGGSKEIFLIATNNLLNGDGVLAVIDCSDLESGTCPPFTIPEDLLDFKETIEKYVPLDPVPAHLKYYVRFPHNELSRLTLPSWIHPSMEYLGPDGTRVSVLYDTPNCRLFYSFDTFFRLQFVLPNINFEKTWNILYREGKISLSLEEAVCKAAESVVFWNGSDWQREPVRIRN
ncbi:MAG: hypothetical protein ACE5LC_06790 [Candidatus Aminicenantales bacterium]